MAWGKVINFIGCSFKIWVNYSITGRFGNHSNNSRPEGWVIIITPSLHVHPAFASNHRTNYTRDRQGRQAPSPIPIPPVNYSTDGCHSRWFWYTPMHDTENRNNRPQGPSPIPAGRCIGYHLQASQAPQVGTDLGGNQRLHCPIGRQRCNPSECWLRPCQRLTNPVKYWLPFPLVLV